MGLEREVPLFPQNFLFVLGLLFFGVLGVFFFFFLSVFLGDGLCLLLFVFHKFLHS